MRRLERAFLDRGKKFAHRMVDVAEAIPASQGNLRLIGRVVDQLVGAGTSVGANLAEASEAISRAEFCKCLSTVLKELAESRFWLEFVGERGWIPSDRLIGLHGEAEELLRICHVMLARTKQADRQRKKAKSED